MSTKSKTLAKSLHTVTVLVQVARLRAPSHGNSVAEINETALDRALETLGYAGAADPYDLRGKALAVLNKEFDL